MNKTLTTIACSIIVAIAPAIIHAGIIDESKRLYCNADSIALIQHYEQEILSAKANTSLILAETNHIVQITGVSKARSLLRELPKSAQSQAERFYVNDMVSLFEEFYYPDTTKSDMYWDIVDNTKERMPQSITACQLKNTVFLPTKNTISVAQYNNGHIPLQSCTQDFLSLGLCSATFKAQEPLTLCIYSNMDYVVYINGQKILVNATGYTKRVVRMIHIQPEGGFSIGIYYKPADDMFLKVVFRDNNNAMLSLPNTDDRFFNPITWYEIWYEYYNQLVTKHSNPSLETTVQLALFFESLHSIEALTFYKEAMKYKDEYSICRFLTMLINYREEIPCIECIMKHYITSKEKYSSVLYHIYYNYVYGNQKFDFTTLNFLPFLVYYLTQKKKDVKNDTIIFDYLRTRYGQSNDLTLAIAGNIASYDILKATSIVESIQLHKDKEIHFLLQCYRQTNQFEKIIALLEKKSSNKYFSIYIDALIAAKKYDEAKSALFKKIAQGFDSNVYATLALIAERDGYDGSMYQMKHDAIVESLPFHSDYMKAYFDNYVRKKVFSQLAYQIFNKKGNGLLYSCYAIRMIHNKMYCTMYDVYYTNDKTKINNYAFLPGMEVTECSIYSIDENGSIEVTRLSPWYTQCYQNITDFITQHHNKFIVVSYTFTACKDVPVFTIQQNYNVSQFDMDIVVTAPGADVSMKSDVSYHEEKTDEIHTFSFLGDALLQKTKRNFLITALTPDAIIEWINEQQVLFPRLDFLMDTNLLNIMSIEEASQSIAEELKNFAIVHYAYTATSLLQFYITKKGTLLDAMLYARYRLAKNGIMSFIVLANSDTTNKQPDIMSFDTVLLYIPLDDKQGIWLSIDGAYPSIDGVHINNAMLIVGDEIITK